MTRRVSWNLPSKPSMAAPKAGCRKWRSSPFSATIRSSTASAASTIEPMQRAADGDHLENADSGRASPRFALASTRRVHRPTASTRAASSISVSTSTPTEDRTKGAKPIASRPGPHPMSIRRSRPWSLLADRHFAKEAGRCRLAIARVVGSGRIKASHGNRILRAKDQRLPPFSRSRTSTPARIFAGGKSYCCRWREASGCGVMVN